IDILTWSSASLGLTNMFVQEQSAAILAGKHRLLVGTDHGLRYQLPAGNLSQLFAVPARRKLEALGGRVLVGAQALAIARQGDKTRVTLQGGEAIEGEHVI